jgi:osmotically-inducible protein OsmY
MYSSKVLYSLAFISLACGAAVGCATHRPWQSGGACVEDAQIFEHIQERLDRMPDFGAPGSIRVETVDRVVYLNGQVSSGLAKHLAETVATEEPGVRRVVASIAIAK